MKSETHGGSRPSRQVKLLALAGCVALGWAALPGPVRAGSERLAELMQRARDRYRTAVSGLDGSGQTAPPEFHPVRETYEVNAQYRGVIKKGFDRLGKLVVSHRPGEDGVFGIDLAAELKMPKKGKAARFEAAIQYRLEGQNIVPLTDESQFSEKAKKHREKILANSPFIYLLRHASFPAAVPATVSYVVEGKTLSVRYARSERHMEATVFDGERWIGKFFIEPGDSRQGPHDYDKFRISTKKGVVISFVCAGRQRIDEERTE